MLGGGFNGGFLNLGTPEVIVIGAVAWAVLGPKELFRLAKQAGEFIGQWQQLGQQARDQFTSALEEELKEDEVKAAEAAAATAPPPAEWAEPPAAGPATPATTMAASAATAEGAAAGSSSSSIPSLADYAAARGADESDEAFGASASSDMTAEEEAALRASLTDTLGEPESNAQNFQEQISGARNAAVLSEYPAELSADDAAPAQDGSALDMQSADEMLLQNQIQETENELAMLQAEKKVLALKRQQLEQNAARARRMAEERAAAEAEAGAVEGAPTEAKEAATTDDAK